MQIIRVIGPNIVQRVEAAMGVPINRSPRTASRPTVVPIGWTIDVVHPVRTVTGSGNWRASLSCVTGSRIPQFERCFALFLHQDIVDVNTVRYRCV